MPYNHTSDHYSGFSTSRDSPATGATKLTSAMVNDSADLPVYAKALRVWNGSGSAVTLMVTPLHAPDDSQVGAVPLTLPPGVVGYENLAIRRIWSTGSSGLLAGLAAGAIVILLLTK